MIDAAEAWRRDGFFLVRGAVDLMVCRSMQQRAIEIARTCDGGSGVALGDLDRHPPTTVRGFGIRVGARKRTWLFPYRDPGTGKSRGLTLGSCAEARNGFVQHIRTGLSSVLDLTRP